MLKRALPLALLFIALDQATKLIVQRTLALDDPRDIIELVPGFLDFCHVVNYGASWGLFSGWRWSLTVFALLALVLLVVFRKHIFPPCQPLPATTLALLLGGIVGNLIDRVRIGGVIDFIHVHWRHTYNFPVFNVADTCITFGLALYIIGQFIAERNAKKNMKDET